MAGIRKLQRFYSYPLPQRNEGTDTNDYRQPIPETSGNYQTFFWGNQLPGTTFHVVPHVQFIPVQSQWDLSPQYTGGSFGQTLSAAGAAQLVAKWRAAWMAMKTRY